MPENTHQNTYDIAAQIAFFACGGTIDKVYYDAKSTYTVGEPCARGVIQRARAALPPITSLIKKDSLDMTDADRALVAAAVASCDKQRIVISHGTDTMADTARAIENAAAAAKAIAEKTVVLLGAFSPAVFKDSDADFNIGFALAAALALPRGVYVAMNGRILPAATATKNLAARRFEETQ